MDLVVRVPGSSPTVGSGWVKGGGGGGGCDIYEYLGLDGYRFRSLHSLSSDVITCVRI